MPGKPSNTDKAGAYREELVSRLYDVALDPTRYEALLDKLEEALGPLREQSSNSPTPLLNDASILDHFRRADIFLENSDISQPEEEVADLITLFDGVAAAVISDRMVVEAVNSAALAVLGVGVGEPLGRIDIDTHDREALIRQIARMTANRSASSSVFRVRTSEQGRFLVFYLRSHSLRSGKTVVIAITSDLRWPEGFAEILKSAFELSGAEVEVVRLLVECCSLKEIAQLRDRSIETVRGQIKTVMAKTETNSQVELVRLVLSMMDIAAFTRGEEPGPKLVSGGDNNLKPMPFHTVYQDDDRRLDYLILGDPNGKPVLFFPMEFGLVRWPATAEAAAAAKGLKIVVPIRGGFGASDPHPKTEDLGYLVAKDTIRVMEAEDIEKCPVIALGADNVFAAAMEYHYPSRLTAILSCAGCLPFSTREQFDRMHKWHRFIMAGAKYTPHLLPFMVKAGFFLARKVGKRAFVHSVFSSSKADIKTFEDPEVFEAMTVGSEVALSENHIAHDAFARQSIYEHRPEHKDRIAALKDRVPVIFFNGLDDPLVHPETLTEFKRDYPWVEFHTIKDAGQLLFFRHWREVLKELERFI